jgi:hypothetical protein
VIYLPKFRDEHFAERARTVEHSGSADGAGLAPYDVRVSVASTEIVRVVIIEKSFRWIIT